MSEQQIRRAFEKANAGRGLTTEHLRQFMNHGASYSQEALNFIIPLLQRNDKATVAKVIARAQVAFNGPDMSDGLQEVFAAANVKGFPVPEATVGYTWTLEACAYACAHFDPTPAAVEDPIPVLQ